MSILNRPADGAFNVLLALYRVVRRGPVARDALLALCAPATAVDPNRSLAAAALETAIALGLFEEFDDGVRLFALLPDAAYDPQRFPQTLRDLLLGDRNVPDLWSNDRAADIARGLCWVLAQDPIALQGAKWDAIDALQKQQLPDGLKVFAAEGRWAGFKAWAGCLGFAWTAPYPTSGSLTIDPTEAIEAALPAVFAEQTTLDAGEFLRRLGEALPVLDGGRYRTQVESRLSPEAWRAPAVDHLSLTLSLALERLRLAGALVLEDRDEEGVGRRFLSGRRKPTLGRFTHVRLEGARP
jgi:hypothetical protein